MRINWYNLFVLFTIFWILYNIYQAIRSDGYKKFYGYKKRKKREEIKVDTMGDERPISFTIGEKQLKVKRIIDYWQIPGCDCFKVLADDGREYNLKHDLGIDEWYLE